MTGNNSYPSRENMYGLLSVLYPEEAVSAANEFLDYTEARLRNDFLHHDKTVKPSEAEEEAFLHLEAAREMLSAYQRNIRFEVDGLPLLEIFDDGVYALLVSRGNALMSSVKEETGAVINRILSDNRKI